MADELQHFDQRRTVSELGRQMLSRGLTTGTGGNISEGVGDDTVAISPSGMAYDEIEPADVPVVNFDCETVVGDREPSSEIAMHTTVHRERDDVGGVVHTHSPYATTFASIAEPIPASHYLIAFVGDKVPVADYTTYGTEELAELAIETLGDEYNACLLKNHGVLAVGEDTEAAFEVALMTEYCARIHYQALNVGEPALLPDEEIDTLIERFADYGQTN
ncbi:fuculose phosphate aldolase [Halobacteriales archaeon QS_1_68_17]|nr:MAG: fuculose phosphate aldolase [Halobacteriales archaeon QS_1_68_17]